ncbi:MAG: TonB-dependent receptor plug domain-containing protein [Myxococcota bacterium]
MSNRRLQRRRFFLVWTCVAIAILTGLNETEAAAEEPEEIVVRGVKAGRFKAPASAFATRIETDDYAGERKRLDDLIGEQVGVQLRRFGGPGEPSELSIRGSTAAQVQVQLDGIPINSVLTGSTDLSQLCTGLIESVDILRGGASLEVGGGAIGGLVDLQTRRPQGEAINRVNVSGGAFGTWDVSAHRAAQYRELDYAVGYCGFTTDGDYSFSPLERETSGLPPTPTRPLARINNHRIRHSANLTLGGALSEKTYLRFQDYITYSSQGEPGLGTLPDVPLGGQNPFAHGRDTQNLARLAWSGRDLGEWGHDLEAALYHRYQRDQYRNPGTGPNQPPVDELNQIQTFGFQGRDRFEVQALGASHTVSAGLSAYRDALYSEQRPDRGRTTTSVVVRDHISLWEDRIALVPGLRFEWNQGFDDQWLPAFGAVITPLPWLRIRGNIQKSYRAPGFDELYLPDKGFIAGNPDLEAESARNADVGVEVIVDEWGPLHSVRASLGYFQQDIDNSIAWVPVSPVKVMPVNTGAARVRGVETSLSFALTRFVRFTANYTGLDAENRATGGPLAGRADAEADVRVEVGESDRYKCVAEYQYTGAIPASASGQISLPARSVWNGQLGLNLAAFPVIPLPSSIRSFWLYASLENISDVAIRDAIYFPQPGRNGHLGMEVEW